MLALSHGERLQSLPVLRRDRLMNTLVSQQLYGIHAAAVAAHAAHEIARLEALLSAFEPRSDVSQLGTLSGVRPLEVNLDTFTVLGLAKHMHQLTRGALDATCGPLCALWRRRLQEGRTPTQDELDAACRLVDDETLLLQLGLDDRPRAFLTRAGQRVDLGAVGKGYAADCCRALYRTSGLRHGVLDLGGNVLVFGGKPDGTPFRIGIQRPEGARGDCIGYVELTDGAVVTSGGYERFTTLDGKRYSHILDPRSGQPVHSDAISASIVSRSAARADALATACIVLGIDAAMALIEALPNAEAVLIDAQGGLHVTSGLRDCFVRTAGVA